MVVVVVMAAAAVVMMMMMKIKVVHLLIHKLVNLHADNWEFTVYQT
jgi:hypothetical protein